MVEAITAEIILQKEYLLASEIQTIYFGGGTPSLLSSGEIGQILETIYETFPTDLQPEITLEANPDDLTAQKLDELRAAGINRLSIGVQSLDDQVLESLNRAHDSTIAIRCLDDVFHAGFRNVSIDLMYAIPQQDNDKWKQTVKTILEYKPKHISSYALTIEEATVFGRWASKGKLIRADDDFAVDQLEILVGLLTMRGYKQYEVSNFSQPGFESRHNSSYWKGTKYLGIGPSAHSFNGDSRQHNVSNNHQYLASIHAKEVPASIENLSREDKINEYLLTTLRTMWGTSLEKLKTEFGFDLEATNAEYLKSLQAQKFAVVENRILHLTQTGMLHADKIASDLFILPD